MILENIFTIRNETFRGLAFYGSLCIVKTLAMAPLTSTFRRINQAFQNPEDAKFQAGNDTKRCQFIQRQDAYVERIRRLHRNDLENIFPFVLLGLLYCGTRPNPKTALFHFKIFFYSRMMHALAYLFKIRQPARAGCFLTGLLTMLSMAVQTINSAWL